MPREQARIDSGAYLLLKSKDVSNAAVYRISKPSLRFITYCYHRIEPLMHRNMEKKLGHVARPKHLVYSCEMGCSLLRIKVRRKYTPRHTLPPQKLARTAWPSATAATASAAAASATTSRVCTHLFLILSRSLFFFTPFFFGYDYNIIRVTFVG